jgi:hypothetical protein
VQPDVDGHEIQAPQDGYQDGKEGVAEVHPIRVAESPMKHQRLFLLAIV